VKLYLENNWREVDYAFWLFVCWGIFQKAGYVTYPGMFKSKLADNFNFRFQNGGNFKGM